MKHAREKRGRGKRKEIGKMEARGGSQPLMTRPKGRRKGREGIGYIRRVIHKGQSCGLLRLIRTEHHLDPCQVRMRCQGHGNDALVISIVVNVTEIIRSEFS